MALTKLLHHSPLGGDVGAYLGFWFELASEVSPTTAGVFPTTTNLDLYSAGTKFLVAGAATMAVF